MVTFSMDGTIYDLVDSDITIYQFCFKNKIYLPIFCYHERLSIAGNCRMCLVEVNNGLSVSCAVNFIEGMEIYTNSYRVKNGRENVLEFLLVNHPLDCPICDQGGECDLQDITLIFGSDRGRYYENKKRAVDNFEIQTPYIKTVMTRCIHCTRCVRFADEVGYFSLGVIGRGLGMEIGTYIKLIIDEALSGNIIDLCPVGALTAMPYAFRTRV